MVLVRPPIPVSSRPSSHHRYGSLTARESYPSSSSRNQARPSQGQRGRKAISYLPHDKTFPPSFSSRFPFSASSSFGGEKRMMESSILKKSPRVSPRPPGCTDTHDQGGVYSQLGHPEQERKDGIPLMKRIYMHERIDSDLSAYIRSLLCHETGIRALRQVLHEATDQGYFDSSLEPQTPTKSSLPPFKQTPALVRTSVKLDPLSEGFMGLRSLNERNSHAGEDDTTGQPHLLQNMWRKYVLNDPTIVEEEEEERKRIKRQGEGSCYEELSGEEEGVSAEQQGICRLLKEGEIVYTTYTPTQYNTTKKHLMY